MRARVGCGLVFFVAIIAATAPACLDPTEIQIEIKTDSCDLLKSVEIYVGGEDTGIASAPSAVATGCLDAGPEDVGAITLVPSGGIDDKIDLAIVGTLRGGTCKPDSMSDPSCIIARRAISFAPHTKQTLTVRLDGACAGVVCGANETCENGSCTSSCQTGCADGGISTTDGGGTTDVVIKSDATPPPQCVAPNPLPTVSAFWVWSFAGVLAPNLQDDSMKVMEPFATGATISTDTTSPCASFLHVASAIQPLSPSQFPLANPHLAFTLWYRAASSTANIFSHEGSTGAVRIAFDTQSHLKVVTIVGTSLATLIDTGPSADSMWHFVHVDVDTSLGTVSAWRDGASIGSKPLPSGFTNDGPLFVGPSIDVDQVQVFAYGLGNN